MGRLVWNPEWDSGSPKIDQDHRDLFGQVELLLASIHAYDAEARVPGLLTFLADYVDRHSREEEEAMEASGYPHLAGHRAHHEEMRAQVSQLLAAMRENPGTVPEGVLDFMTDWLVKHINEDDRAMAQHLCHRASGEKLDRT